MVNSNAMRIAFYIKFTLKNAAQPSSSIDVARLTAYETSVNEWAIRVRDWGTYVFGRALRHRGGAMAAEFALITPVLFTLILGSFEYGTVMLAASDLQLGANVMARQLAVNDIAPAELGARMAPMLPPWVSASPSITVSTAPGVSPGHELVTVRVEMNAVDVVPVSILTRIAPFRLSAASTAVRELVYEG